MKFWNRNRGRLGLESIKSSRSPPLPWGGGQCLKEYPVEVREFIVQDVKYKVLPRSGLWYLRAVDNSRANIVKIAVQVRKNQVVRINMARIDFECNH